MDNSFEISPYGSKSTSKTHFASPKSDKKPWGTLEPVLSLTSAPLHETNVLKALQRTVRTAVDQYQYLLSPGSCEGSECTSKVVQRMLNTSAASGEKVFDILKSEWRHILSSTLIGDKTPVSTVGSRAVGSTTPAGVGVSELQEPNNRGASSSAHSPMGANVLCFDCDGDSSLDDFPLCGGRDARDEARELIQRWLDDWSEEKRLVPEECRDAFVKALRVICEGDVDNDVFDSHWLFWSNSLVTCLVQPSISWDAVELLKTCLYDHLTMAQRILLVESITMRLRQLQPRGECTADDEEVLLEVLHNFLLRIAGDSELLMDDELGSLLVCTMHTAVAHIGYFEANDPSAQWLEAFLRRPALARNVARLPETHPELVCKMLQVLPMTHAINLVLPMLPLWVKGLHDKSPLPLFYQRISDNILAGRVRQSMLEDALCCLRRSVCGLPPAKRQEYVDQIYETHISGFVEKRKCGEGYKVDSGVVLLVMRLLLILAVPSGAESDGGFRLLPRQLREVERCLLKRADVWSNCCAADVELVNSFWCEMLYWYAGQLPNVVNHIIKATIIPDGGIGTLWNEKHLIAISTATPAWLEVERALANQRHTSNIDLSAVLHCMCSNIMGALPSLYRLSLNVSGEQGERRVWPRAGHNLWWLIMRWCTNATLRHHLLLATTEAIESLTSSERDVGSCLLADPVEEMEVDDYVMLDIPLWERERRRKVRLLQSIRLWIVSLCPTGDEATVGQREAWDAGGALLRQIKQHWLHHNNLGLVARRPFGDDSLIVLLCTYMMSTLTSAAGRVTANRTDSKLRDALHQILLERRGIDPVQQILLYLTEGADCRGLAGILAHRFNAECDSLCDAEAHGTLRAADVPQSFPDEKELKLFKTYIREFSSDVSHVSSDECSPALESVLLLILQLHEGNVVSSVSTFSAHPLSRWESYGNIKELSADVEEHIHHLYPNVRQLLRYQGVDLYYLTLLCIGRWLRDPWKAAELATYSMDVFVRLGRKVWEGLVAKSLYEYIMMVHRQSRQQESALRGPWVEVPVFPVSHFWTSCITNKFTLLREG
uniref:Uncharacterized protein TCIL3000_11_8000 n=1 Tax=Trypanosoma congolense (strain IL3000) TaxID=1068625 RepID=G0V132_TRYCI|nr:unnamed protein product [Trypanosoma congolense IL3000]